MAPQKVSTQARYIWPNTIAINIEYDTAISLN